MSSTDEPFIPVFPLTAFDNFFKLIVYERENGIGRPKRFLRFTDPPRGLYCLNRGILLREVHVPPEVNADRPELLFFYVTFIELMGYYTRITHKPEHIRYIRHILDRICERMGLNPDERRVYGVDRRSIDPSCGLNIHDDTFWCHCS